MSETKSIHPGTPLGGHNSKRNDAFQDRTTRVGPRTDAWKGVTEQEAFPTYTPKKSKAPAPQAPRSL